MQLEARLRAFAAFARRRSFSAAAAELRISQPAVSKHVADLERALGLKLVERARRDGAMTSAGDFIANYVLRAESLLAQAALGAAQFRESGAGSLTIVASWLTGTYLLPEIIAEFRHLHPAVHISLELGTAAQAVEWLRSHRAELGFIAGPVGGPEIEAEPLLEYEIVIVGQPALVPIPPSRESLEAVTWISREEGSATRIASDAAMARLGIVPRRRLELPSYEAVVSALKRGYGVAAISRYVVATELRAGLLTVITVRGWNVRAVVSVLRVREARLTPSAQQFQGLVRNRLAELSAGVKKEDLTLTRGQRAGRSNAITIM
jgi:LysR family transcriptional regulator, transcriptional activator of the cysJI operon